MSADVQGYVVGFALDDYGRVALIEKNRPAWQAGRLNGIGGHVEPGETPDEAMRREFCEETGVMVEGWERFVTMRFPGAVIDFYRVRVGPAMLNALRTTTDEPVIVADLGSTLSGARPIIPNLSWLLPLAAYTADRYDPIEVVAEMAKALTQDGAR